MRALELIQQLADMVARHGNLVVEIDDKNLDLTPVDRIELRRDDPVGLRLGDYSFWIRSGNVKRLRITKGGSYVGF